MNSKTTTPDYLFESSWEVCNKVGGIYTVLSTKARTLQQSFQDRVIFIGPDVWGEAGSPDFIPDDVLYADWAAHAQGVEQLKIKVGRWNVPGMPPVVLVDFKPFFPEKDAFYYEMWTHFGVDSLHAYGDYDESCMFAYAVGKVIESFYHFYRLEEKQVAALFNEWMLGMAVLYVQLHLPAVATLFTTHATSIGRSIAGNGKALYAYMEGYHGDQMARELNMEAKHSLEKQAAHHVDCFTTVSDITARECKQLLEKAPDVVTPNGFEPGFVPVGEAYKAKRAEARRVLLHVAEKLLGCTLAEDTFLVSTSGRYEYRNKGIDLFIEAMSRVRKSGKLPRQAVAFIMVPAWVRAARADLKAVVDKDIRTDGPMQMPFVTHWLNEMEQDRVLNYIASEGFTNGPDEAFKIIFVPCYLDGRDGIFNRSYYDLLIGMDATVYPSYYEPWGYTPLESVAFGIPTITTDLAGFGLWAKRHISGEKIDEGVEVVARTDFNYFEVATQIASSILSLMGKSEAERGVIRQRCFELAAKAEWSKFIIFYEDAFRMALAAANARKSKKS